MGRPRFFVTEQPDAGVGDLVSNFHLNPGDLHHAAHVLRLSAGDEVEIVTPDSSVMTVKLVSAPHKTLAGHVAHIAEPLVNEGTRVTLVQGLPKGDKLDLVIEKAVEIGVDRIIPVMFERSVVRLDPERARSRGERLRRIAAAAAKQSRRVVVPDVLDPIEVSSLLPVLECYDIVLVALEDFPEATSIRTALSRIDGIASSKIAIVVGPEGGLTSAEVESLLRHGAHPVSFGSTVLRTETAGIVGSALVIYECGGLGGVDKE